MHVLFLFYSFGQKRRVWLALGGGEERNCHGRMNGDEREKKQKQNVNFFFRSRVWGMDPDYLKGRGGGERRAAPPGRLV